MSPTTEPATTPALTLLLDCAVIGEELEVEETESVEIEVGVVPVGAEVYLIGKFEGKNTADSRRKRNSLVSHKSPIECVVRRNRKRPSQHNGMVASCIKTVD